MTLYRMILCHTCGAKWAQHTIEQPPLFAACTGCGQNLQLVRHDPVTQTCTFRAIPS